MLSVPAARGFLDRCLQFNPDWIVAIPSEGVALLNLGLEIVAQSRARIIYPGALTHLTKGDFKGRRVLVLDFAVLRGRMMSFVVNRLLAFDADVRTAAYVVHCQCPAEALPDVYETRCNDADYGALKEELIATNLDFGHSYDSDHWDVELEVDPFDVDAILKAAATLGILVEIGEPDEPIRRVTVELGAHFVDGLSRQELASAKRPRTEGDTVRKIRLFVDPNTSRVSCVGLWFPVIPVHAPNHVCQSVPQEMSVCNLLSKANRLPSTRDCFDTLSFFRHVVLVREIMLAVRRQQPDTKVRWSRRARTLTQLNAMFPLVGDQLADGVERFFCANPDSASVSEPQLDIFRDTAESKDQLGGAYVNGLVAAAVYRGWSAEVSCHPIDDDDAFEQWGASFQEVVKDTRLPLSAVSSAFDMLLDAGVIRPLVSAKNVSLPKSVAQQLCWVRTYRPAGEHMRRLIGELALVRHRTSVVNIP
jgi:hypothetical protein